MFEILARTMRIATLTHSDHRLGETKRFRSDADQYFWQGRRWKPENSESKRTNF